jgi:hypothetical protein
MLTCYMKTEGRAAEMKEAITPLNVRKFIDLELSLSTRLVTKHTIKVYHKYL